MRTTRREFFKAAGAAGGMLGAGALLGRGALAQTRDDHARAVYDGGVIQLHQNESARGPGARTIEAIHRHTSRRVGRGYAPDHVNELRRSIADAHGVGTDRVQLATGSTPLLQAAPRAFCAPGKPLVTAAPTYSTCELAARAIGAPVRAVPLDGALKLDLEAMAAAAQGAGMVFLCNPNNPSGTVHGPEAVEGFVRRVMDESPGTFVHIDEAYIAYADPEAMRPAVPLTREFKNVFITRSFSKAHGIAGLRVGYALGHPDTLAAMRRVWGLGDVNMLGAVAALTVFEDAAHMEWERGENALIRGRVVAAFNEMGYEAPESHTNHVFVNLGRPAREFRAACLDRGVLVGRDFRPLENTHCRISLGSREEMARAVEVFREVLA